MTLIKLWRRHSEPKSGRRNNFMNFYPELFPPRFSSVVHKNYRGLRKEELLLELVYLDIGTPEVEKHLSVLRLDNLKYSAYLILTSKKILFFKWDDSEIKSQANSFEYSHEYIDAYSKAQSQLFNAPRIELDFTSLPHFDLRQVMPREFEMVKTALPFGAIEAYSLSFEHAGENFCFYAPNLTPLKNFFEALNAAIESEF